jgi:hypothetical protein
VFRAKLKTCPTVRWDSLEIYEDVGGENDAFPREDWKYEVRNNYTNLGYGEWVEHKKEVWEDEG